MNRLVARPLVHTFLATSICLAPTACVDRVGLDAGSETDATEDGGSDEIGSETSETETSETGTSETGTSETETSDTGELPAGFCADACATTSPDGCFTTQACLEVCAAESPSWTEAVGEAFALCAAENPLCFETLDGCMLAQLNPEGTPLTIRVEGAGFEALDGAVIRIWHDPQAQPAFADEAVIRAGVFAFEWQEPVYVFDTNGPLMLLYIDVDDDGTCTADVDPTAAVNTVWNGDLLAPAFESVLTAPLQPAAFVCEFLP